MTIATILPPARTTFLDANADPLSGGFVYFYVPPNTTTLKTTYQDSGATIPNSNPVVLDGNGSAVIYGTGQYLMTVRDSNNNIVYTGLTEDVYGFITTGNNTFSGNNTFTGSVALGSSASATTQIAGDTSTAVATDAFVANAVQIGLSSSAGGLINKFRNGNFFIGQRGYLGTATSSPAYGPDGWIITSAGANITWSLQGNQENFQSGGFQLMGATGNTDVTIQQRIEGHIVADMFYNGVCNVTFQFQIVNSSSSAITPNFAIFYANNIDNWGSSTQDGVTTNLQTIPANSTAVVCYTWSPGSAYWTNGIDIILGVGAITSGNNVQIRNADIRATPGLAVGLNSTPPTPELRPLPIELLFCKRYYTTTYGNGVAPGTATQLGFVGGATNNGSINYPYCVTFPTSMRVAPSIIIWDGAGNVNKYTKLDNNATTNNVGTLTVQNSAINGFQSYEATGCAYFHYTASAEL